MTDRYDASPEEIDALFEKLDREAEAGGYHLNPDTEFTKELVEGLIVNEKRYGYQCCPCRLSEESREKDLDVICPCDYRDPDLEEFGTCYCGLYVSQAVVDGDEKLRRIPERRPAPEDRGKSSDQAAANGSVQGGLLSYPVWRCKVCGYLAAREQPPGVCPICKASKDRFERFM